MKKYCVTERWVVEHRHYVYAESETEANHKMLGCAPRDIDYIEVVETIIDEIPERNIIHSVG